MSTRHSETGHHGETPDPESAQTPVNSAGHATEAQHHGEHDPHEDHDHHEQPWIRKYVFSTDHKVIGIQYGISALLFLFLGFLLIAVMRWPIAYGADKPMPFEFLRQMMDPETGIMSAETYNIYGAMHGTIMVFLAVVPLGFAAFGNYVVPLQIGAPDMAFPRLNMWSFWTQLTGGLIFFFSFWAPGGAAKSGWTSYTPLSVLQDNPIYLEGLRTAFLNDAGDLLWWAAPFGFSVIGNGDIPRLAFFLNGQSLWLFGMVLLITASLLGAVNFITTVIQLRAPGMTWMRMPYLTWAMFVTAFLLLLAFPPLEAAGIMQLLDRVAGTSFFMPSGLVVGQQVVDTWAGGGSPLLYQHLFWFLGHPEVYVLLLPAVGIATEIIACNTRKPIWGYKSMVFATLVLGFLSMIVWAHHMYLTGMGTTVSAFFQTTTMIISIPSVILLTCLLMSLWGGSIRFNTPMLFATAFLPMFGIGGLTGLPLGFNATDIALHDTYYVIGHFHYMLAPGIMFGLFAGIYHYFPKITGRYMNEFWGKCHFWTSFILMNFIFFPMLIQGMAGMHRRMYDGGETYDLLLNRPVIDFLGITASPLDLNMFISWSVWALGIAQIPFILNFFLTIIGFGKKAESDNPWHATTLEWQTPTPPPHGNFTKPIRVYRESYEYSLPGWDEDFTPQNAPPREQGSEKSTDKPSDTPVKPDIAPAH